MIDANVTRFGEDTHMLWVDEVVGVTTGGEYLFRIVDEHGNEHGSATMEVIRESFIPQADFA